jgi:catechol 2,3-dioxygenase-like lactoylglutathione lyase family enzyme
MAGAEAQETEAALIPVKRLGHVTFETPDVERQVEHYTRVVGLTVASQGPQRVILTTPLGEEAVVLERGPHQRCTGLSLQVDPGFDLAVAHRKLQENGVRSERRRDITPGLGDVTTFAAPDGVRVDLFGEERPASHAYVPTGLAPVKLGHIAFMVPDPKLMVDFYTGLLGFRVSDWAGDFFAFLRCGPDHHTVNFLRGDEKRMHHFAFELKDWAHVQQACELFGRTETPIIWGPGRHGIGHNIFLYHFDPDGQVVEYYTEMDQMKDESLGYFEARPWHKDRPQRQKVWDDFEAARLTWGTPPTPAYRQTHAKRDA